MVFLAGGDAVYAGDGPTRVWAAGADGLGASPLTNEPGLYFAPRWCDGGRRVLLLEGSEDASPFRLVVWPVR